MLAGFAMIWGLGSIGVPLGMFGTTRLEKNISRHIWRFISLHFSLLVIYATYLLAKPTDAIDASAPGLSPSPPESDVDGGVTALDVTFAIIGLIVMLGHIISWSTVCYCVYLFSLLGEIVLLYCIRNVLINANFSL
jgi:hypothetical protein